MTSDINDNINLPDEPEKPDTNAGDVPPENVGDFLAEEEIVLSESQVIRKKKSRLKKLIIRLSVVSIFAVMLFIGFLIMFYPQISDYVNDKNHSRAITSYDDSVKTLSVEDYTQYLEAARAYNARLAGENIPVHDAFEAGKDTQSDRSDEYWHLLDVSGKGVMGYVTIPKVNIKLPIYHGTSEFVLALGAGHIPSTSLPVGGESTHSVISAHTGQPSAKLFTGIDQLVKGDTFQLHILNDVLTYQVDQILTVLPYEIDSLGIIQGGDYVTLVTCTPYGINTHRLLIRGVRIETPSEEVPPPLAPEQPVPEALPQTWWQKFQHEIVVFFAAIVESVAQWLVDVAQWGMDIFGVEY